MDKIAGFIVAGICLSIGFWIGKKLTNEMDYHGYFAGQKLKNKLFNKSIPAVN